MSNFLLIIHIVFGSLSLICGTLNMCLKKGDKRHALIGKWFVISMLISAISAIVITFIRPNFFLLLIGIFSLYLTLVGFLYIRKNPSIKAIKLAAMTMLLAGLAFIAFGLYVLQKNSFGIVPIVFGIIGIALAIGDFKAASQSKNERLLRHIQRMSAAYISTCTAFLVVNISLPDYIPAFIPWLLPTAIITPLIFKWSRHYTVRKQV